MPLHNAVWINSKKGTTTENQGSGVKYMGYGVYLDDCVYPPWCREKVMVYYYYIVAKVAIFCRF